MNILAIIGSPHGMKGNTGRLLDEVLVGVRESGGNVDLVSLTKQKILPCVACDTCHRVGVCNINDDFEAIKEKLLACDAFILASPNYIFGVTAQMKALFDRCGGLIHLMALEGKYGIAVETSGGGEDEPVLKYMEQVISVLGARVVGSIGSPMAGIRTFPDEETLFAKARELGGELCRAVREKRHYPEQDAFHNDFTERMRQLMLYRQSEWEYEFEVWQALGKV
jgi:multimeric flavodoxin WrbA